MKHNHVKSVTEAHGVKLLHGNHKEILKLKKKFKPTDHGHKVWPTSWLLIDYLNKSKIISGKRVMDLGCGWGLTGIYCAKNHNSQVTSVDVDSLVEPYVRLMAETNEIEIDFLNLGINRIKRPHLKGIDVIVASDICFCDTLIDPLRRLIHRAKSAGVQRVLISDPGRWPFDDLCDLFIGKKSIELIDWRTQEPVEADGKILSIIFIG